MGSNIERRNPLIKRLLTSYKKSSESSLSGPTELKLEKFNVPDANSSIRPVEEKHAREQKSETGFTRCATFMTMDNAFSGLTSTELEGETIACFEIGGEKRLCLAQILKNILSGFTLPEIHAVFESLHVFSAICSPAQLKCLKEKEIIPPSAPKCGLITKSDAQRFCSVLLREGSLSSKRKKSISKEPFTRRRLSFVYEQGNVDKSDCFGVAHKCFGGCRGTLILKLYRSSRSPCIQCNDCTMVLSPERFVSHFHAIAENRQTCHWGFDSANWRHYLELDPRELPEHKDTLMRIKQHNNQSSFQRHTMKDHVTRRVLHHHHHQHHHLGQQSTSSISSYKTSKGCLSFSGTVREPPPLIQPMTFRAEMEGFAPNVSLLPCGEGIVGPRGFKLSGDEKNLLLSFRQEEEDDEEEEEEEDVADDEDDDEDFRGYRRGHHHYDDDDDEDGDDCDYDGSNNDEYDARCLRRGRVPSSTSAEEDVRTIQQLDDIQETELKLFRMALDEGVTDADKSAILEEFCTIQRRMQALLEDLVAKNKHLSQKHRQLSCQRDKKDQTSSSSSAAATTTKTTTTSNGWGDEERSDRVVGVGGGGGGGTAGFRLYKKRHCQTASPTLQTPVKKTNVTADEGQEGRGGRAGGGGDSDRGEDDQMATSSAAVGQVVEASGRPHKRKRCNTYSSSSSSSMLQTSVKMETG